MKRSVKTTKPPADEDPKSTPEAAGHSRIARDAVRRRPPSYLGAAAFLAILVLATSAGVILLTGDPQLSTTLSDVISPVVDLSAAALLFIAARRTAVRSRRLAIAWGTIALAMLSFSLGGVTWLILEVILKVQPFPTIADGFYLAYYPIFLVGVFILLEKSPTTSEWINRGLDIAIVLWSATLGFWNFLIGPIMSSNAGQPLFEQGILLAYPVGDLVLFAALILILYDRSEIQDKSPIYLLAGSLLVTIVADSVYSYQTLLGTYISGGPLDLGWIASSLLACLAGISQWVVVRSPIAARKITPRYGFEERLRAFSPYLPYVWLALVLVSLGPPGVGLGSPPAGLLVLSLGVAGIVVLVISRQIIAISQNSKMSTRLQTSVEKVQAQATELEKTNLELQLDIAQRTQAEAALQESEALFRTLFELSPDAILLIDPHDLDVSWPIVDCNMAAAQMNGYARDELVGQSIDVINTSLGTRTERDAYMKHLRDARVHRLEARHRRKDGTEFLVDVATTLLTVGGRELVVGIDHDITERNRKEEEGRQRLAELEAINKVSSALRAAQTLDEMLPLLLEKTMEVVNAAQGSIWLYNPTKDELAAVVARGYDQQAGAVSLSPVKPGQEIAGQVFVSGQPLVSGSSMRYPRRAEGERQLPPTDFGGAAIPIRAEENVIGALVINVPLPRELAPGEIRLLTTLSEIAGNAIRRTTLHQQIERRVLQLTALSEIGRTITSSFDLHMVLTMLLNQVVAQLGVDAADVLLSNPAVGTLNYAAGSGFRTRVFQQAHLRMGEGYAGRAALERNIIHIPNLAERDDNPLLAKALAGEVFVSYFAVPLLAKGQIKGVLEIFHRAPLEHDAEWLDMLKTLAEQAAIAIDNATLFDNLQRSNLELALAYDATIEGWSRALDLRDKETEGHTQRVTDMTVKLARTFDLGDAALLQVRWGALLHDIGKLGVPDGILLKPGPLSDEEWVIMKKHPVYAREMLLPIQYLRSALDIPSHHHEKWDGTGYPQGLKGDQIPLSARIFAVVDVWDALRSDRPYRPAWSSEKVREHVRSLAGSHFDPQVVRASLESGLFDG